MLTPFPLELFEFTYLTMTTKRVMFCWIGRDEDDANDAFEEMMGVHPVSLDGIKLMVRPVTEERT